MTAGEMRENVFSSLLDLFIFLCWGVRVNNMSCLIFNAFSFIVNFYVDENEYLLFAIHWHDPLSQ